ncbi:NADH-quinone oxidoreductase subunit D-related protein, partial [Ameyamaea chiangmaiensis]|nr:hypothetical protein [Ameyamaea chiangmaiensis]
LGWVPAAGAAPWRAIAGELERIMTHLHDLARMMSVLDAPFLAATFERAQEAFAALCGAHFGHRRLMDVVQPGGLAPGAVVEGLVDDMAAILAPSGRDDAVTQWRALYERQFGPRSACSLPAALGVVRREVAGRAGTGGVVGRSAGLDLDLRVALAGYRAELLSPVRWTAGDVDARIRLRLDEIADAARQVGALAADALPPSAVTPVSERTGEGIGVAEGPRGIVAWWVQIRDGVVQAAYARDPDLASWSIMETTLEGAPVEALDIVRASFGADAGGADR